MGTRPGMDCQDHGLSQAAYDLPAEGVAPEALDMNEIGIKVAQVTQQLTHGQHIEADLVGFDGALAKLPDQFTSSRTQLHLMPPVGNRARQVEGIGSRVRVIDSLVDEEDSHDSIPCLRQPGTRKADKSEERTGSGPLLENSGEPTLPVRFGISEGVDKIQPERRSRPPASLLFSGISIQ